MKPVCRDSSSKSSLSLEPKGRYVKWGVAMGAIILGLGAAGVGGAALFLPTRHLPSWLLIAARRAGRGPTYGFFGGGCALFALGAVGSGALIATRSKRVEDHEREVTQEEMEEKKFRPDVIVDEGVREGVREGLAKNVPGFARAPAPQRRDWRDKKKGNLFHLAARVGVPSDVRELSRDKLNVNHPNKRGDTPLHTAVKAKNIRMVRELLMAGARADIFNAHRQVPFVCALETHLEEQAEFDEKDRKFQRFHEEANKMERFREKLEKDAQTLQGLRSSAESNLQMASILAGSMTHEQYCAGVDGLARKRGLKAGALMWKWPFQFKEFYERGPEAAQTAQLFSTIELLMP